VNGAVIPVLRCPAVLVRGFVASKGRDLQGLRVAFVEDTRAKEKQYRMDSKTLKFVEMPDPVRGGRQ
jgi:hypothetical protein